MNNSDMKNMVVLKNLPSNLIEEAIVVLKPNKKVKKIERMDKSKNIKYNEKEEKDKNYIVKEAEMLVNTYVSKMENNKNENLKKDKKHKYLKKYNILITAIAIVEFIGLILN